MVNILNNNEKLTPYVFYSRFLYDVAKYIQESGQVEFKLAENGDSFIYESNYNIDPITIPLLLSLVEQLSKFYKQPINLALYNNLATKNVLNFLYKSDFFYVAGNNRNPYFPIGRNILKFKEEYLGDFISRNPRSEHKVRCYSIIDNDLDQKLCKFDNEDQKRDFLISQYIYTVRDHFKDLLIDNINTNEQLDLYIEILSELITNGVLHSKSNTFALMFVNRFATKFSISDNGIGFSESLKSKKEDFLYKPFRLKEILNSKKLLNVNFKVLENLSYIIETLYFSSLKDRKGLFDLMISVVINSNGYFRLHSENTQIIISNRMSKELLKLKDIRDELFKYHRKKLIKNEVTDEEIKIMSSLSEKLRENFILLYENISNRYNDDYRYSSLRFFNVKFRGVHIEVEIPSNKI
ncbi:hypothetical protein [Chryseobacterium sp. 2987]|uniref:hypothetical protein n=1 Tax=Chryseobacterium sp. 2987 TaxID=2817767 RepID=UPI002863D5E6|nr:hypothetical protein [Chryseobacterium sp. 2987]MDR6919985.1 hypothetical protein [Chryseobacterium sp. 2987]